jgi:hypothetical protein
MHVVRQAIKLCDDDRSAVIDPARGLERGGELGPAAERVRALAGFRLGKALDDSKALLSGEPGDCRVAPQGLSRSCPGPPWTPAQ